MSARPWYKRYGADFVFGTMGLTLEERGAYSICLDLIYDRQGPIPDDARYLAGVCGVSVRKWNAIRDRLVDAGKLHPVDGALTNSRAVIELENAAKTARKLAENGAKGGNKSSETRQKANENSEAEQAPLEPTCGLPDKKPEEKRLGAKAPRRTSPDKPVVWSPQFEESYAHYPDEMKRSKSRAACWPIWQAAASKAGGEGALAGAVRRYRAEDKQHKGESKAPAFDRWLRDGRWEHWLEVRVTTAEARWTGPPEIRARVAMEQTDAFARSYLDPAEWTPDGIRPANGYAFDKLRHLRSLKDVKLLQPQERAA